MLGMTCYACEGMPLSYLSPSARHVLAAAGSGVAMWTATDAAIVQSAFEHQARGVAVSALHRSEQSRKVAIRSAVGVWEDGVCVASILQMVSRAFQRQSSRIT